MKGVNVNAKKRTGWIIAAVVVLLAVVCAMNAFTVVEAGHTGVVVTFGKVNEGVLQEGLHVKVPFVQQVVKIDWEDPLKAIPAFIAITAMPFTYSISEGIAFGFIFYTLLHVLTGKLDKVTPLMYVLTVLFIMKYIFL